MTVENCSKGQWPGTQTKFRNTAPFRSPWGSTVDLIHRENVPAAPDLAPAGYSIHSFVLCNSWLDAGDGLGQEPRCRPS